jgi:RNA polymerase sigma-70 factor, ECF subfamily
MDGEVDDLSLLKGLRAGDSSALEVLMGRYAARVYRLAQGITRSASDAEEVVQDVFMTIYRKGDSFEGRSALGSWIYRVTINTALNRRRGKRQEVETSIEEHLPAFVEDGHRAGDRTYVLADWSQDPEAALLSEETRGLLNRAIDSLRDDYRTVLVLRDVEDLPNAEIAETIGESVASVKSRVHRARMALREQLTRHLGPRA